MLPLDVEREKSLTTAGRGLGRIPTLGPGYQLRGTLRKKSGEGPSGPLQAFT